MEMVGGFARETQKNTDAIAVSGGRFGTRHLREVIEEMTVGPTVRRLFRFASSDDGHGQKP